MTSSSVIVGGGGMQCASWLAVVRQAAKWKPLRRRDASTNRINPSACRSRLAQAIRILHSTPGHTEPTRVRPAESHAKYSDESALGSVFHPADVSWEIFSPVLPRSALTSGFSWSLIINFIHRKTSIATVKKLKVKQEKQKTHKRYQQSSMIQLNATENQL